MAGAWSMTEEGEFVLNEPYKTKLFEAKHVASTAWRRAICEYLAQNTHYTVEKMDAEFVRRVQEEGMSPVEIVDEFVIEALEGNL